MADNVPNNYNFSPIPKPSQTGKGDVSDILKHAAEALSERSGEQAMVKNVISPVEQSTDIETAYGTIKDAPKAAEMRVNTPTQFSSYDDIIRPKNEPAQVIPKPTPAPVSSSRPIIRTYKTDVEETVQSNHLSSINIAVAENERLFKNPQKADLASEGKKSRINKSIIILSIILVFGGGLAIFVPYMLVQRQEQTPSGEVQISTERLFTADSEEKINLGEINLARINLTLAERVEQALTQLGQIKSFFLTETENNQEKTIPATRFLNLLGIQPPESFLRTLRAPYAFGMHNFSGTQKFLVLKVGAYDITYAAMLNWERTLWQDFKTLFSLSDPDENIGQGETLGGFAIETKPFQDATYNNRDARIIKSVSGQILFLYSIVDQNTVVITTSPDTLRELLTRMQQARIITQ